MTDVLAFVSDQMEMLGLTYEFMQMTKTPLTYPYWVGEVTEPENITEDGKCEPTVILTGFTRGSFLELEQQKTAIKDHFLHGQTTIKNGTAIAVFYGGSLTIPIEDDDLKKCQVNLSIKTWKGK